eukprot:352421-Chlamydomonas_euryale.AAC.18
MDICILDMLASRSCCLSLPCFSCDASADAHIHGLNANGTFWLWTTAGSGTDAELFMAAALRCTAWTATCRRIWRQCRPARSVKAQATTAFYARNGVPGQALAVALCPSGGDGSRPARPV